MNYVYFASLCELITYVLTLIYYADPILTKRKLVVIGGLVFSNRHCVSRCHPTLLKLTEMLRVHSMSGS